MGIIFRRVMTSWGYEIQKKRKIQFKKFKRTEKFNLLNANFNRYRMIQQVLPIEQCCLLLNWQNLRKKGPWQLIFGGVFLHQVERNWFWIEFFVKNYRKTKFKPRFSCCFCFAACSSWVGRVDADAVFIKKNWKKE